MEDYYELKKRIVKSDVKMSDDRKTRRQKMGKMNEKKVSAIEPSSSNISPLSNKIFSKL